MSLQGVGGKFATCPAPKGASDVSSPRSAPSELARRIRPGRPRFSFSELMRASAAGCQGSSVSLCLAGDRRPCEAGGWHLQEPLPACPLRIRGRVEPSMAPSVGEAGRQVLVGHVLRMNSPGANGAIRVEPQREWLIHLIPQCRIWNHLHAERGRLGIRGGDEDSKCNSDSQRLRHTLKEEPAVHFRSGRRAYRPFRRSRMWACKSAIS